MESNLQDIRTEASQDPLRLYMLEARHELLTAEEEKVLGRRVQAGDLSARNELVRKNLRLVIGIASRFHRLMPMLDLIQEGNIGLIRAAEKFQPDLGYRFSTYATWWVRQRIFKTLLDLPLVRIPQAMKQDMRAVNRAEEKLLAKHGREPTDKKIADFLGFTIEQVLTVRGQFGIVSMDQERGDDYDLHDALPDEVTAKPDNTLETNQVVEQALALFTCELVDTKHRKKTLRMKQILELAYGLNGSTQKTPPEIAAELNMSVGQVNEQLRKAIAWLKRHSHRLIAS
ncbi:MAG: sigma-70 family RNA polymerase sigma factor [Candidatus Moraniibacteriota bacterium]